MRRVMSKPSGHEQTSCVLSSPLFTSENELIGHWQCCIVNKQYSPSSCHLLMTQIILLCTDFSGFVMWGGIQEVVLYQQVVKSVYTHNVTKVIYHLEGHTTLSVWLTPSRHTTLLSPGHKSADVQGVFYVCVCVGGGRDRVLNWVNLGG